MKIPDWMLKQDKTVLYLVKRMVLPSATLQLIAARLGNYEAERLCCAQLAAKYRERLARWRASCARSHWTVFPPKPSLLMPGYQWFVTDGAESFKIRCFVKSHKGGGHNWYCCSRRDIWFTDFTGNEWWGIHLAQEQGGTYFSNDVVRCRKLKQKAVA
jgi:hypothetical protein